MAASTPRQLSSKFFVVLRMERRVLEEGMDPGVGGGGVVAVDLVKIF